MINVVIESHTVLFSGQPGAGKTKKVLDLLEQEYRHHFDYILILCPTLRCNKTYLNRPWLHSDKKIFIVEPKDKLFEWIGKLTNKHAGDKTLFIVDDVIADETLGQKFNHFLELAISGRHRQHSLWLLTQSYTVIPKNLRRMKKMMFMWYPNEKSDLKIVDEETNIIQDLEDVNQQLKSSEHACLYIRLQYPCACFVISNTR